jgi:hypothetical protein
LHDISGCFEWDRQPDGLSLPPETGLVTLVLDGERVAEPRRGPDGRLWLGDQGQGSQGEGGDRLGIQVYRRIDDDLPLRVTTRLELEVAGRARLVTLSPVLLPEGIPMRAQGPIPLRLDAQGRLQLQVRPGSWTLELESQHPGDVDSLTLGKIGPPWPEAEVWSFASRPDLRQVQIEGAPAVDPLQSGVPREWSRLPAYRVVTGETLRLVLLRRGDPDPGPDRINLSRDLWLDFDGGGYSVRDRLTGTLTRSWRLELRPQLALGQVAVDGEPRLITRLAEGAPPGVEVRRGRLDLSADSRLEADTALIPVSGWGLDLGSIRARLHLPPGWDLLGLSGADNLPSSWLARWTLLDLFIVLILTLGVARLWGWPWGLVALAALVLTWHVQGAPRFVWLHLLAACALMRFMPDGAGRPALGRLRQLVQWYFRLTLLALLVLGLPFLVAQVRDGIWPQLERPSPSPWQGMGGAPGVPTSAVPQPSPIPADLGSNEDQPDGRQRSKSAAGIGRGEAKSPVPERSALDVIEPGAKVQTGPGIPDWEWTSFDLAWTGPVPSDASVRLWLLTPRWHLVWSIAGALLSLLLALRMTGIVGRSPAGSGETGSPRSPGSRFGGAIALLFPALLLLPGSPNGGLRAEGLPSPELLGELRSRLLEPPDCLPACVDLARLDLSADTRTLRLVLTLDAAASVAAPIPGGPGSWLPERLVLDGETLDSVRKGEGAWLQVPLRMGRHRLVLEGPLPDRAQVEIALPLSPRHVQAAVSGWTIEGLGSAGRPGAQIRLARLSGPGVGEATLVQEALPPLLFVERTLALGIDWRVDTRVRRLSPVEPPVLVPVPLLPGESVQTPEVQVQDGQALASLAPGVREIGWTSTLEPQERLSLRATTGTEIVESWSLDLSPRWHLTWRGIAPVGRVSVLDRWAPTWRPLPGESLELVITRPDAVPGAALTLDNVAFAVRPGRRASTSVLRLALRSTQGGTHAIRLPDGAEAVLLVVDGQERPLPRPGEGLELPVIPGSQAVVVEWREQGHLTTRLIPRGPDLRSPAVNLNVSVTLPQDRWVLYASGPRLGPVVLFWATLLVLAGLALVLGRIRLTPLRALDWLLLGAGISLAQLWAGLLVAGWLFALGLRRRMTAETPRWRYNLVQTGVVLVTVLALVSLVAAVSQGLLGRPDMQILGNGSHAGLLNWYQDRGGPGVPEVTVVSVPIWVYRILMLAWALWLARRLLDWLRWGWGGFSQPVLWREGPPRRRQVAAADAGLDNNT